MGERNPPAVIALALRCSPVVGYSVVTAGSSHRDRRAKAAFGDYPASADAGCIVAAYNLVRMRTLGHVRLQVAG
ncbi:hypothetical protein GCM10009107_26610 [Ideonella azotifigens]|uniref:Transposase n=1 Tax=Ideonella azotifigens TaxID=513160 RepID=A0ABN1K207_9BURK